MHTYSPNGGEAETGECLGVSWTASLTKLVISRCNEKLCLKKIRRGETILLLWY